MSPFTHRTGADEPIDVLLVEDDPKLRRLPVVVLTGSVRRYRALLRGRANAYLTKSTDLSGYVSLVDGIERFWLEQATLPSISA